MEPALTIRMGGQAAMRRLIAYLFAAVLALSCVSELEQGGSAADTSLE